MNKKLWRDDMTMMYFINTTASRILSLADGKNTFSELVAKSFVGTKIKDVRDETLESFHLKSELNDRFLLSVSFCVSMWERGILSFKVLKTNLGNLAISPLLTKAIGDNGELSVEKAYGMISNEDKAIKYNTYNQFKTNLAMLIAFDMLSITFKGTIEDCDEEVVSENDLPQYKVGYIQPGLLTEKPDEMIDSRFAGQAVIVAALVGKVVDVAIQETGTTAGDIVGQMESN